MIGNLIFYVYVLSIVTNLFNTTWKDTYLNKYGNVLILQKNNYNKNYYCCMTKTMAFETVFFYLPSKLNKQTGLGTLKSISYDVI